MLRGVIVVFILLLSLVAGCGDDGAVVSTPGEDDGASAASDQDSADDAIAALEHSLRDDGFSIVSAEDDDFDLLYESEQCREFDEAIPDDVQEELVGQTASAASQNMTRSEGTPGAGSVETVAGTVWFVEKPEDLGPVLELLTQRVGQCLEEAMRITAPAADDIEVEQLESGTLGDASGGARVTAQLTVSANTAPASWAVQFARAGRALAVVAVTSVGTPDQPSADLTALLQALVGGVTDQATI